MTPLQKRGVVARAIADGKLAWRADLAIERPISADADRVYVPTADGIQAVTLKTGALEWRADTGLLTADPLVHAGWVVAAAAGSLAAYRAADGTVVWRRTVGPIEFRPAIDGDLLFVPLVEGPLLCLNLQTGDSIWERQLGGAPGEPLAVGGKVYVGAADKYFYVLDAADGDIDWPFRIGAAPRGRAAVDEDHVYLVALDNMLRAFDRGHGAIRWTEGLKYRPAKGPSIVGGAVMVPGAAAGIPVFGRDGGKLTELTFPATLVSFSDVSNAESRPLLAAVTGDLEHPWTLWLLEPSTDPPAIPMLELKELPGETIVVGLPY